MAKFSDVDPITVHTFNGRYVIAKHSAGHCFISVEGTREACEQLTALVRLIERGRTMRGLDDGICTRK